MAAVENGHFPVSSNQFKFQKSSSDITNAKSKRVQFSPSSPSYVSDQEEEDGEDQFTDWKLIYNYHHTEVEPPIHDPRDDPTPDNWIKRNPSLIRLNGTHPFVAQPPLSRLMTHGFITPVPLHYVHNHGPVPKATWETWAIEVSGLVKRPLTIRMDDLVNDFPPIEIPVTLACAGNRCKEQNTVRQSLGFNWGPAGVSTSVWRGARLCDVLRRCGVKGRRDGAMYVCFEGEDGYATSLEREKAMDSSRDIMLAYEQNGELLTPDQGFPVRVIVPGCVEGRMVKWLKRIVVTSDEANSQYHYRENRVLPSFVDAELANDEDWWKKPEHIVNDLNINSVITTPGHEEILTINSFTTQRPYVMKGYAYSGGGKKVTRVEVSFDSGESWLLCTLTHPERPNKYGKYWCWCFWSLEVEVVELLNTKEVMVRAWDETHNTQPEKLIWNVLGSMNNCWYKVKINMCRPNKREIGVMFEHPIQPGDQPGGWMARQRHLQVSKSGGAPKLKKSTSSPFLNTAAKTYTISEVRKHNSKDSTWIVVHGHVYDCTKFVKYHPGGADSILINAGTDCTEEFDAIHSDKAKAMLEKYLIGELIPSGPEYVSDGSVHGASNALATIAESSPQSNVALVAPGEKVQCKLVSKRDISRDVRLFRFALPSSEQTLGLPVGKHIFVNAHVDGKLCMRAYTPTSTIDTVGYFELLIKVYFKDENPKFPNGGIMSQYLESMAIGSTIEIKGPLGHIEYKGKGNFLVNGVNKVGKKLAMIAGGTGITPMYQVMQAVLKDPEDTTEMSLVYANKSEDDILLKEELDGFARDFPTRVRVWYVVDAAKRAEEWKYSVGFVTERVLKENVPEGGDGVLAMACGPPPMIKFAVEPNLKKLGYDTESSLLVF